MRIRIAGVEYDRVSYGQSEAAELIGVQRQTIAAMIAAGNLRAIRLGRRVLIPATEIARLLGEKVDTPQVETSHR